MWADTSDVPHLGLLISLLFFFCQGCRSEPSAADRDVHLREKWCKAWRGDKIERGLSRWNGFDSVDLLGHVTVKSAACRVRVCSAWRKYRSWRVSRCAVRITGRDQGGDKGSESIWVAGFYTVFNGWILTRVPVCLRFTRCLEFVWTNRPYFIYMPHCGGTFESTDGGGDMLA